MNWGALGPYLLPEEMGLSDFAVHRLGFVALNVPWVGEACVVSGGLGQAQGRQPLGDSPGPHFSVDAHIKKQDLRVNDSHRPFHRFVCMPQPAGCVCGGQWAGSHRGT